VRIAAAKPYVFSTHVAVNIKHHCFDICSIIYQQHKGTKASHSVHTDSLTMSCSLHTATFPLAKVYFLSAVW